MKVLVVSENENIIEPIKKHLPALGFDIIIYSNPVKAIDNLREIAPDLVLFNAQDYPRHWEPFLVLLRVYFTYKESVFVLLKSDDFGIEKAAKATYLNANGIVEIISNEHLFIEKLKDIFIRHLLPRESRRFRRYFVSSTKEKIDFIFNHPVTMELITGDIVELSLQGITILIPKKISSSIEKGTKIENCSIKIGGRIITVDCTVERNNYYITLFFDNLDDDDSDFLEEYFDKKAERELMHKKK